LLTQNLDTFDNRPERTMTKSAPDL
jgi:hypothetical protein